MVSDLDAVGATALGVALVRALESSRQDALFDDPLAKSIARIRPYRAESGNPSTTRSDAERASMYHWIVARTLFLDDVFDVAAREGVEQFVILGSGLDGRGFRMGLGAQATLFELDRPTVVDVKEELVAESGLSPVVDRRPVSCDLNDDWLGALQDKGFRSDRPSAWLAEGLLVYLPDELVVQVVEGVSAAAKPRSRIGVTVRSRRTRPPKDDDPFAEIRALWRSDVDVAALLDSAGWANELGTTRAVLAAHGRPLPDSGNAEPVATLLSGIRLAQQ